MYTHDVTAESDCAPTDYKAASFRIFFVGSAVVLKLSSDLAGRDVSELKVLRFGLLCVHVAAQLRPQSCLHIFKTTVKVGAEVQPPSCPVCT
jgi:hypothetical protein